MERDIRLSNAISRIIIQKGCIKEISKRIVTPDKVLLITDEGVPKEIRQHVLSQFKDIDMLVLAQGEKTKSIDTYLSIIHHLIERSFSRNDLIIALGGGVITDLSGFVAATYKRGCRLIFVPTTTLAQIDASVGGKVGINVDGIKNNVGSFYHPETVFIDTQTLSTLPKRHYYNGLVEALKVGLIGDCALYQLFKEDCIENNIDEIIERAILYKIAIVESDEKEQGIRKILNFGHTIGHAIESFYHLENYLHGECVANGMLCILEDGPLKKEVTEILHSMNIPILTQIEKQCFSYLMQDKKIKGENITIVKVDEIGKGYLSTIHIDDMKKYMKVK